jgi:hypothetical protein
LTISLFCERLKTFLSKNAICCEDANNLINCVLSRNVKCDRKMRFQIFFLQKYFCEFVFVIMLDHLIVYVRLSDSNFFEMTNALTRATHQTWRKRLIKLDTSDISSSLISNISSNLTECISSNLIKLDEDFVCLLWWAFLSDEQRCRVELSLLFRIVDRRV